MLTEAQQQLHCKNCRPNYCTAKNEEKVRLQGAATIANAIIAPVAIAILENGQGSRHRANSVASKSGVTIIASQNQGKKQRQRCCTICLRNLGPRVSAQRARNLRLKKTRGPKGATARPLSHAAPSKAQPRDPITHAARRQARSRDLCLPWTSANGPRCTCECRIRRKLFTKSARYDTNAIQHKADEHNPF